MITKAEIKLVKSLAQKKDREELGLFVAEGVKTVQDLIQTQAFKIYKIFCSETIPEINYPKQEKISIKELNQISFLKTPHKVVGVFHINPHQLPTQISSLTLALDNVRDPGNMGTIIRLADWYGIRNIICSSESVDCYNPKVVQSTMGSLGRVKIVYTDLPSFLSQQKALIYGAFLEGENVYRTELLKENSILVMGNEAQGISPSVEKWITHKLHIPSFGKDLNTQAESLNVAIATAILCSEFKRS